MKRAFIVCLLSVPMASCDEDSAPGDKDDRFAQVTSPVEVERLFGCDGAMPTSVAVASVTNTPADEIRLRKFNSQCMFQLVYRTAAGVETLVSNTAGGYFFTEALADGSRIVLCASRVDHVAVSGITRRMNAVELQCSVRNGATWGSPMGMTVTAGTWAAWLRSVVRTGTNTYKLRYERDSTFAPENFADEGRPSTDGVYEITFTVSGTSISPVSHVKVDNSAAGTDEMVDETPGCPFDNVDPNNPACLAIFES